MKEHYEKIKNIYNNVMLPLDQINNKISITEKKANDHIQAVKKASEAFPLVSVSINEKATIAYYIKESIGLFIEQEYSHELKEYTAKKHASFLLWYKIRDNIYGYYTLLNAEVKKDYIKLNGDKPFYNMNILKEYANGRIDVKKDDYLIKIIEMIQDINNKYYPKN